MPRPGSEEFKTYKDVFDQFTNTTILKLISKGHLDGLEGPISIGKEANIFSAQAQGERVAVKIYRINTCDFNKMYEYLRADPRFPGLDKNQRKVIMLWAQREYRNLFKAREAGVRVPTPRAVMNNVLVMEYIGEDNKPAPRLKDAYPENPQRFFDAIVDGMKKLYKAGLVHTDLSAFNLLNHNEEPVFIDLSQATILDNPYSKEYIERDVRNVCHFFRKNGLDVDDKATLEKIRGAKAGRKV
jgi:RIO kinase 1